MRSKRIPTLALLATVLLTSAFIASAAALHAPSTKQPDARPGEAVHPQAPDSEVQREGQAANLIPSPIERDLDPVIVTGAHLPHLAGTPTDSLFVYAYRGGGMEQIPFQVDQVTDSGAYTSTMGSPLDEDDEIVFMAFDLGERLPDEQIVEGLPIIPPAYRIAVTDPLDPGASGWAYIVRSSSLTQTFTQTYASFDSVTERITTTQYAAGFISGHPGLDYFELHQQGQDILDRTKLRLMAGLITFTEDSLGAPPPSPVKDGPVRVIVPQRGILGYRSLINIWIREDLPAVVTAARLSTDFNENATGATFHNANTPAGVTIDGNPTETVSEEPLSPWWQVTDDTGTIVQVADSSGVGGTQTNYYKDDDTEDPADTGDRKSYGDAGIHVQSPDTTISYRTALYVLPAGLPNVGAAYAAQAASPLQVMATALLPYHTYLPILVRN